MTRVKTQTAAEKNGTKGNGIKARRTYKDTMFRKLFSEKENLLSLYNAINGTDYTDVDALEINTMENIIYMGLKNDLSYVINFELHIYEHQSSINPNMPLRDLFYATELLQAITSEEDLYSSALKKIPTPRFIMFYNGAMEMAERWEIRLSDAFLKPQEKPELELIVTVLNINLGKNKKVMDACKTLKDYAIFVQRMRDYTKIMTLEEAIERTINECISEGVLADFLKKHRAEAKQMCRKWYEYDEQKHIKEERRLAREAGWEEGHEEGRKEGRKEGEQFNLVSLVLKKLKKHCDIMDIADMLEEEESVIRRISEVAEKYAPDYDVEKMREHLSEIF